MNVSFGRLGLPALLFVVVFISGYALSRGGRPYGALLFNAHKLVALTVLALLAITANGARRAASLTPLQVGFLAAAGLFFVLTIVTGGLNSIEKPMPAAVAWVHKVLPYLTLVASLLSAGLL